MLRQKREESGTCICHVMQGKESKTCPYDFSNRSENRPLIQQIREPSPDPRRGFNEDVAAYMDFLNQGLMNYQP